ncbi:MAG: hypothetical protein LUQ18_10295, partial [Methylococcaceae bacterium]|nr:hypothetical protein [Methylococcaceae bacterium]
TPAHDILLATQILQWQWVWYWGISDEIIKITSSTTIESWKNTDPLCSKYAWYNILMYFATARAEQLELTKTIRCPQRKICLLCTKEFVEDSLPMSLIGRLGTERVDFCAPCLKETILGEGNSFASEGDIFKYLHDVTNLIERVPSQSFGEGMTDLLDMQNDERLALLKLLQIKPSVTRVKSVFGSWLNALIQAGVLEDGTRKTSRGIQSIAKDGHVCLSLGERTIDDFLYSRGVHHEKEPRYPEGNYRGDFKVGNTFIEYFGLAGNLEYDEKTEEKIRLCKKHGITLIAIYPKDLISRKNLENKLLTLLTR